MFEMKCCGVTNSTNFNPIADQWKQTIDNTRQVNPVGCCTLKTSYNYDANTNLTYNAVKDKLFDPNCPIKETTYVYKNGCVPAAIELIRQNLAIVIGVCVGFGLFEILCIVFACCVARQDD